MTRAPAAISQTVAARPTLQATDSQIKARFLALQTFDDVANLLEIKVRFLRAILFGTRERSRYTTFSIPKRNGGFRVIQAPPKNLRILQQKANYILGLMFNPRHCVHGFSRERSVKTNADMHSGRRWVLNVDLRDFFGHVTIGRIIGVLRSDPFGIPYRPAVTLAQIATVDDGKLPQGSPCSPVLSNLVAFDLDSRLMRLAKKHRCTYSRYADDITLSTSRTRFPPELAELVGPHTALGDELVQSIEDAGFRVNPIKVRLQGHKHRQEVTGLIVNEFTNVRRSYVRSIRSVLHAWRKYGEEDAQRKLRERTASNASLPHHLRGKLAYLQMIRGRDDPLVRRLLKQFAVLCPALAPALPSVAYLESVRLRGHLSPSLAWEDRFRQFRDSIWFLEITNTKGELNSATAFKINDKLLATAGHNLELGVVTAELHDKLETIKGSYVNIDHGVDVGVLRAVHGQVFEGRAMSSTCRLPEIGEQVAAIGFPTQPLRHPALSLSVGVVESLPVNLHENCRFIQVSFQSAGGLSGAPLIDRGGHVLGIVVENTASPVPNTGLAPRSFAQVIPFEYLYDLLHKTGGDAHISTPQV